MEAGHNPTQASPARDSQIGTRLGRISFDVTSLQYLHMSLASNWRGAFLTHVRTDAVGGCKGCWSTLMVSVNSRPRGTKSFGSDSQAHPRLRIGVPGQPYEGTWTTALESTNLFIDTSAIEDVFHAAYSESLVMEAARNLHADPMIEYLQQALLVDVIGGSSNGPLVGETIVAAILQRLQACRMATTPASGRRLSQRELRRLRDYVTANLAEPLHLTDLAQHLNTSVRHLCRTLKAATGLSPHQFVMRYRLEQARQLLARSELSLDEIAEASGFADRSHLSSAMRNVFNVTPSQIRQGCDDELNAPTGLLYEPNGQIQNHH